MKRRSEITHRCRIRGKWERVIKRLESEGSCCQGTIAERTRRIRGMWKRFIKGSMPGIQAVKGRLPKGQEPIRRVLDLPLALFEMATLIVEYSWAWVKTSSPQSGRRLSKASSIDYRSANSKR